MKPVSLSVSIVIYDLDESIFELCIASLREALDFCIKAESITCRKITIVDNGDNHATLTQLLVDGETYIQSASNVGFGTAHNRVIAGSDADYHLIMNPDLILEKSTIANFVQLAESEKTIALIGPRGKTADGENAFLAKRYPAVLDLFLRGFAPTFLKERFQKRLANYEYQDVNARDASVLDCVDVQLISGCCMFVRTVNAQAQGSFDERYFLYFEDFDFSLNLGQTGRVVYAPGIEIIHFGGNSARKGLNHIWLFCRSAWQFYNKHGWKLI